MRARPRFYRKVAMIEVRRIGEGSTLDFEVVGREGKGRDGVSA
jgi:hypothetical protein